MSAEEIKDKESMPDEELTDENRVQVSKEDDDAREEASDASDEGTPDTAREEPKEPEDKEEAGGVDKEEDQAEEPDKSSGKKKDKEKKKKKDKKDELIEELTDKVKRQLAEFENFRNRTEKEKSGMYEMGAKSVIEKMLPVLDNFERGLAAIPEEEAEGALAQGMQMIYKQMVTELENLGVKPIEAVGKEFDPNFHNAVMQMESEEFGSGMVASELQKGYMYRDTVVRHSMVAVVQ